MYCKMLAGEQSFITFPKVNVQDWIYLFFPMNKGFVRLRSKAFIIFSRNLMVYASPAQPE